tara:strand:- start:3666 stop:4367 length:702 start_codon:yes stop_codon:yes gene_type:complete
VKVSIHQPNFLPWAGFFSKMSKSEKFVILDTVKCSKNSYLNRNRFSASKNLEESFWLSIPLRKESYRKDIKDVFCIDSRNLEKHIKYFKNRHGKTCEKKFLEDILGVYEKYLKMQNNRFNISQFNIEMIKLISKHLEINTEIVLASNLSFEKNLKKQDLVIDILKNADCSTYVSGLGAREYQEDQDFLNNDIEIVYNNIDFDKSYLVGNHHVSIVDLMLREGIWKIRKEMILA